MSEANEDSKRQKAEREYTSKVNQALGIFLLLFGVIILFSIFLTDTFAGQMTNLAAGLIITGMGGGFYWKGSSSSAPSTD
jgi:hypothetical protein